MYAKEKLNAAYLLGSLLVAAVLGAFTESLVVFLIALLVLVGAAYHARCIRD